MNLSRWLPTCWMALSAAVTPALAQLNAPHLAYALPAGGQQGTTFQIKLGGEMVTIPFHRVKEVYRDGSLIWHRST